MEAADEKRFKRPRGRGPLGKLWSYSTGTWVDDPSAPPAPKKPSAATAAVGSAASPANGTEKNASGRRAKRPMSHSKDGAEDHEVEEAAASTAADKSPAMDKKGFPKRPRGRPPKGKTWDHEQHKWVPESPEAAQARKSKAVTPKRAKKPTAKRASTSAGGSGGGGKRPRGAKGKHWEAHNEHSWVNDYNSALPELEHDADEQELPAGWLSVHDPASGKFYYYHKADPKNPTWTKPTTSDPMPAQEQPQLTDADAAADSMTVGQVAGSVTATTESTTANGPPVTQDAATAQAVAADAAAAAAVVTQRAAVEQGTDASKPDAMDTEPAAEATSGNGMSAVRETATSC